MRHHNSTFSILFFALLVSLTSCGQKSSHEEDLKFYTTIGLQMKDVAPKVQIFWGQMKQGILTARENESHKLGKTSIDSLKMYLSKNIEELEKKIKIVNVLSETDNDLNFKKTIIDYLEQTKTLQETAMPKVLELLENGLDKINDQQKDAVKIFMTQGQELQIKSKEIEDLSLVYQKKHKITNKELDQYGL